MAKSRIEWDEIHQGWAIYCCECGEYLETVAEKPEHTMWVCGVIDCDEEDLTK